MDTPEGTVKTLENAKKAAGSWRKLAVLIGIPAGTLCRIAKGHYLPRNKKYLLILGVKAPSKPRSGKNIQDMSAKELKFLFEHRLEM